MPLRVLDPEAHLAGLRSVEPDLAYLLHDRGVSEGVVALLGHSGCRRLNVFAKIERGDAEIRAWLDQDFQLKASDGMEAKVAIACVIDAWEAAKERVSRQAAAESQARVDGRPKELLRGTHLALRRAFAGIFGETEEKLFPSRQYMDLRLDQIEEGELKAETLSEVTSLAQEEEGADRHDVLDIRKDGSVKVSKKNVKGEPPRAPEQLRVCYKIMANHWQMVKIKLSGKPFLAGHTHADWEQHISYLLGEEVWELDAMAAGGQIVARPTWLQVLEYEYRTRKETFKLVNEGATLTAALAASRKNESLRSRYLVTPMAVAARASAIPAHLPTEKARDESGLSAWAGPGTSNLLNNTGGGGSVNLNHAGGGGGGGGGGYKGAGRGAGKGGGKGGNKNNKGGGKGGANGGSGNGGNKGGGKGVANHFNQAKKNAELSRTLKFTTADGRKICFKYNKGHCAQDQCAFAHVCAKCEGAHPYQNCPNWAQ